MQTRLRTSCHAFVGTLFQRDRKHIVGAQATGSIHSVAALCNDQAQKSTLSFLGGKLSLGSARIDAKTTIAVGDGSAFEIELCVIDAEVNLLTHRRFRVQIRYV